MTTLNDIFNEFARAFVGVIRSDRDVAFPGRLSRQQLDGSIDSLKVVDQYLSYLHDNSARIAEDEWHTTVLWAGAYVGEVIRHARPDFFTWVDYDEYVPQHPEIKSLLPARTTATCGLLVRFDGAMSMPLNKIARYIDEGSENSVHFFAACDLAAVDRALTQ